MKKRYNGSALLLIIFLIHSGLSAQTIWDGQFITFTKENYTNWNLPENQDRITDDIWITRGNSLPIFNIAEEDYDLWGSSPADTKWAFGSIAEGVENLLFDSWGHAIGWYPPGMVDRAMVLFLVTDSIYIDIKFISWTSGTGAGGGGFSYERSTGNISETLWTGDAITFTKVNNADWTQAENQDRITDNVWITRADEQGLFNIAQEDWFSGGFFGTVAGGSPFDTEWAFGSIADGVETLDFDYWGSAIGWAPPGMVGQDMVLHLISENIYIDIKFTSWTSGQGAGGGGFSYDRSTGTTSETFWTGDAITFTKSNYADWTLPENQDQITDQVWITRADSMGIFNIAYQDFYQDQFIASPTGTKWAFGKTAYGIENLEFDYFLQTIGYRPPDMLNKDMVLWLVAHDIYIDIRFTSWTSGRDTGGGGFSYTRATAPVNAIQEAGHVEEGIFCYPNPASEFIYVKGIRSSAPVKVNLYDITGKLVESRILQGEETVPVQHLQNGYYLYTVEQDGTIYSGSILIGE